MTVNVSGDVHNITARIIHGQMISPTHHSKQTPIPSARNNENARGRQQIVKGPSSSDHRTCCEAMTKRNGKIVMGDDKLPACKRWRKLLFRDSCSSFEGPNWRNRRNDEIGRDGVIVGFLSEFPYDSCTCVSANNVPMPGDVSEQTFQNTVAGPGPFCMAQRRRTEETSGRWNGLAQS